MYKLFFSFLAILTGVLSFVNRQKQVEEKREIISCHPSSNDDNMNRFVNDAAFVAFHPTPSQITYAAVGVDVNFPAADGKDAHAYLIKANKESRKWLFVFQEWWGLNDFIKKQSDQFYADLGGDVNVLALDMYDGKVTTDQKEAGELMQKAPQERLETIVKAAIKYAGSNARIANVGWCFGGGWSLRSALLEENQNIGCVMYYGMPVKDVEKLRKLNSDVLGLFANEQFISKEIIDEFAQNMRTAGKTLTYKIFDAVHAFANPSNPKYDEAKAKEAYGMALAYLKKRLAI
jgi:carboxymethylenebutenolidase